MSAALDHDLIADEPTRLFMGELPRDYVDIPAPVVVNLCGVYPAGAPQGLILLGLPMHDTLDVVLMPSRTRLETFLDAVHVHTLTEDSYWHCHAGINRSGLALAAYLHRHRGMRISAAIACVREHRSPMVLCNKVFERTLRAWYGADDEQEFTGFNLETYLRERRRRRDRGLS